MTAAISAEGLVKTYGKVRALDGVDLAVEEGTVLGLLGPNGAGKTTCVRILSTLLRPDAGRASVGVTGFYNRYTDLIDFDFQRFLHVNRSQVEARGIETTASWSPLTNLSLHGGATWQQVEDLDTHAALRHRPKWVGSLRLDWRPAPRLDLALNSQAVSQSFDEQIPVPQRDTVAGYGLLGLHGTWRLGGPWEVKGSVDNLTGKRYETLIGFPGAGRSVRLGLRYASR